MSDVIRSMLPNQNYRDNYDRIFGKTDAAVPTEQEKLEAAAKFALEHEGVVGIDILSRLDELGVDITKYTS